MADKGRNIPPVTPAEANVTVQQAFERIARTFGSGTVPAIYQSVAQNPTVLDALVTFRGQVMDTGELDAVLKEWLAWAAVILTHNAFGVRIHTARLRRLGVTDAQLVEALGVLGFFSAMGTVAHGIGLTAEDALPPEQ
ncbi:carboxymuconolactone decarboxylase family protein [Thermorudis peleae]|uniref:carboxymuconolactone decarboxylase family protein n=1 Tax=Thermorudis peleae TaxID=1382356 RepID=UPI00056ECF5A|nr:carboxymuconolactone decarboxylase family protein [Thermorudis peleae]MBX6753497.1 carboxymuconolactone decarboxylase family protein [Thermorudis peleae]